MLPELIQSKLCYKGFVSFDNIPQAWGMYHY
jgi:hypothetical protein